MQLQRGKVTLLEIVEIDTNHVDHHLKFVHEKRKNLGSLRDAMRHATALRSTKTQGLRRSRAPIG